MSKLVIYGATAEDRAYLSDIGSLDIVFEKRHLGETPIDPAADYVAIFSDSIFINDYISPKLKVIINRSSGIDNIKCLSELHREKIKVIRNKDYATQAVAEYSLQQIFSYVCQNFSSPFRIEAASLTIAIIGMGNIGKRLHQILDVMGCKTIRIERKDFQDRIGELSVADVICLHMSLDITNHHVINEYFFRHVKEGAVLINAARGELVSNKDLAHAINTGRIAKAILDVVEFDKGSQANELLHLKNVVYTNHTAWKTQSAFKRSQDYLRAQILLLK